MLAIDRRIGSKTYIYTSDGTVIVKVVGIHGEKVRLSIDAPRHIEIERDDMIKRQPQRRQRP